VTKSSPTEGRSGAATAARERLAVALISGGLDSCVATACSLAEGRRVHGITFDYGQRHRVELAAADRVAEALGLASHRVVRVDLAALGGSALTAGIPVPRGRTGFHARNGIPITYVPARNTVFLALALGLAEVLGAEDLVIGANSVDYSGYPDCREEYLRAFERLAGLATAAGVEGRSHFRVVAPLVHMTKAEIVRKGIELEAPLSLTHSCYDPVGDDALACGVCDSCILRRRGFHEAGVPDPTRYAESTR
jgi:7-cyano-7-deazaguanine synthase